MATILSIVLSACATASESETFSPLPPSVNTDNQKALIDLLDAVDFPQAHHIPNMEPKDINVRLTLFRKMVAGSLDGMGFNLERAHELESSDIDLVEILERFFVELDFNFQDRVYLYKSTLRAKMGEEIETGFKSFAGPYAFQLNDVKVLNGSVLAGKLALRNTNSSHGKILKRGDDCVLFWNGRVEKFKSVTILPQAGSIFCRNESGVFETQTQIGGSEEISDALLETFMPNK